MHTKAFFILLFWAYSILPGFATVKIMPLGNSITWDWHYFDNRIDAQRHGYRNYLWYLLQADGYDVDFVGSRSNGSAVTPSFDGDNEGHTGWTTHQIADKVYDYLSFNPADIILLHIGTNDSAYYSESYAVEGVEKILDEIDRFEKTHKKKIYVIVATIVQLYKNPQWVENFNTILTSMLQKRIANGDDIVIVHMCHEAGLNYWADFVDGIHPNNSGYKKMADAWYVPLKKLLDEHFNIAWLIPTLHTMMTP